MARNGLNIDKAVANDTALHYINAPDHAAAIVRNLRGHVEALFNSENDDPLLYAYEIRNHIKRMAAFVIALDKWSVAVIDATPEQIQESGAQLCR